MSSETISDQQQFVKTTKAKTVKTRVTKKIMTNTQNSTHTTASTMIANNTVEVFETTGLDLKQRKNQFQDFKLQNDDLDVKTPTTPSTPSDADDEITKVKTSKKKTSSSLVNGKKKSKKIKKSEAEKENISVWKFEEKMKILSNKTQKSKSAEHNFTESAIDCFLGSSNDLTETENVKTSSNEISKENDCVFASIKENPFIVNSLNNFDSEKNGSIDRKPITNNKTSHNFHGSTKNRQLSIQNERYSDFNRSSVSKPSVDIFLSLSNRSPLEDVLANIDVKHLKTVYLAADSSSHSYKTHNRSINKVAKQGRSLTIKNLCQSFGDLSFINDGKSGVYHNYLKRAKSVGDLEKFNCLLKYFKYYGVSVKELLYNFCNFHGLEASVNIVNSDILNNHIKKSSFSKFDALQKKNLIHVRSSDAGKAQEKFTETNGEEKQNCRVCQKQVYKMEEIKAEKSIYHTNCFRCKECEKQLKVDNYQSHEGVLYCKAHFKLLFSPKIVEDSADDKPRKPELIIRENQPIELPPDVVRASDKPDLGLEELQQINVRSKFEAFEKSGLETNDKSLERSQSTAGVKRSASILSKLAKFQAKGLNTGFAEDDLNIIPNEELSESENELSDENRDDDPDLVRAKRAQRERPVGLDNMNDIKTKFESGHIMSKEERREERKQEIQNIRSRLFMGKQARIKEMYQQAVAESEYGITSVGKKSEIDIGDKARSLKEKFEKGEIFKEHDEIAKVPEEELEVFESAISKKSRSLFKELDASAAKNQRFSLNRNSSQEHRNRSFDEQNDKQLAFHASSNLADGVVKHDEKVEDVQVETSDISSKFKFFETYTPAQNEKKTFRITPPREGVVKLPTPETESDDELAAKQAPATESVEKTHTATIMLNKFREMEQTKNKVNLGPRPLKCFTPPPDEGRRVYNESDSDMGNMSEEEECEEDEEDGDGEEEYIGVHIDARSADQVEDEALKQAQAAARAKQLRAKFEKWEANEIQREIQDGTINLYGDNVEENQIESARAIRARFENMKETKPNQSNRPRYKVNRFVVNGADVSNLPYEEAVQLFINAEEPILVEVRRRCVDENNKFSFFNYDTHKSPTLAVIASSNSSNIYDEEGFYRMSKENLSTLKTLKKSLDEKPSMSSISCQTELSAANSESNEVFLPRQNTSLNNHTFSQSKPEIKLSTEDAGTIGDFLGAEFDIEEITLKKSESAENLGFTISYKTDDYYGSDSGSDECLHEYRDLNVGDDLYTSGCKIYVSEIIPNSLADRDGRLRQGDRILQINGQNVLEKTNPSKLLTENKCSVKILVSRYAYAGEDDFLDSAVYCDDKECQDYRLLSSNCDGKQQTYESQSPTPICESKEVTCSPTTITNIYPILPISVENVSDLFNHACIKAQLESVNKEINLLNSQISSMKLHQVQMQTIKQVPKENHSSVLKTKEKSDKPLKTKIQKTSESNANLAGAPATPSASASAHAVGSNVEIEHIYETIREDAESDSYYCSPYEGINELRVEQWLKSIGCKKSRIKTVHEGEGGNKSDIINLQPLTSRLQKHNQNLDDNDNSSSAYNTGGSCNSVLLPLDQQSKPTKICQMDAYNSKNVATKCKNKFHAINKMSHTEPAKTLDKKLRLSGNSYNPMCNEKPQTSSCVKSRTPVPSTTFAVGTDADSDGRSTLVARSSVYTMCQFKSEEEYKEQDLPEMVWKVKRRPDGTRYIVRRVINKCTTIGRSPQEDIYPTIHQDSAASTKKHAHKLKDRRLRHKNPATPSKQTHHAQHWLV